MFEYLKARDISGNTKWLEVPAITPGAKLEVRPANESNNDYYNGSLKLAASRARTVLPAHVAEKTEVLQNRQDDRVLYPRHIVVGWDGVVDENNNPVEFTPEHVAELFDVLPDLIVDFVRVYCMTPTNFLTEEQPSAEAVEDAAKK